MKHKIRRMCSFSYFYSFHRLNCIFCGVAVISLYFMDLPSASGMEREGLSRLELIRQQCDGLPTSRRLLLATPDRQKKEYRFSAGDRVDLPTPSGSIAEGAACDVWDIQTTRETWVAIVLTNFRFQRNDSLFVVRDVKSGKTLVERFGLDLQTTGFSSMGLLTLLWVRRNLLPAPTGNGPLGDRTLAFFYFTDDAPSEEEDNDELILISAIIISLITLAATVLSLVRSASCHRACLPCWLRRRHRVFDRNSSSYSSASPDEEHAGIVSRSTVISTARGTLGRPEAYLLMEMEVTRSVTRSNDEDNNNSGSDSNDMDDEVYESMLPPRYDQVVGHLVNSGRERERRTRDEQSNIPEAAEDVQGNNDDASEEEGRDGIQDIIMGQSLRDRGSNQDHTIAQTSSLTNITSETTGVADTAMLSHSVSLNQSDLHENASQRINLRSRSIGRTNDERNDSDHNDEDEEADSMLQNDEYCSPPQTSNDTATTALIMNLRTANDRNARVPTTTSTRPGSTPSRPNPPPSALLRSAGIASPLPWRPCLGESRGTDQLEVRVSLLREYAELDGTQEAPPPSYYEESPPPSYDSIYPPNNL